MTSDPPLGLPLRTTAWFRRPSVLDRVTIVVSALAAIVEGLLIALGSSNGGYLALAVSAAGIVLGRRWLWIGVVVTALAPLIDATLGYEPLVVWTIAVFTAFSVTVRRLPALWVGLVVAVPVYSSIVIAGGTGFADPEALAAIGFAFAAAAAGSAVRSRFHYWQELERRAREEIARRDADVGRRVTEERLRIARDLHDVVGHEIAVLGIHLGVLEVGLPPDARDSRASLGAVRDDVRSILHETQRILQILRTDEGDPDGLARPAPDFAGIERLVEAQREAGVRIDPTLAAEPADLDPEVGTAAFRIVQEVLTNFQRHGAGVLRLQTAVEVEVLTITASNAVRAEAVQPDLLRTDALRPEMTSADADPPAGRGYGLIGMRERATSAGGRLSVVDDGRTFTVTAVLRVQGGQV